MKIKLFDQRIILGSLLILSLSCSPKLSQRTVYFPKQVTHVDKLPPQDNLWVFMLAGQSNMAGRGLVESQDTISHERILTISQENEWILAKEPLHPYEPNLTGLDCGLAFGKELIKHLPDSISIALIPCAVGGSAIQQWLGDSTFRGVQLMHNFQEKAAFAKQYGRIKGVLWHQGESNATAERIPLYAAQLEKLLTTFRDHLEDENLPILIGELGSFAIPKEKSAQWDSINQVIHQVAASDPHVGVVQTDDLEHKGDHVHFNSASQRILGRRFAEKYMETSGQ
ncbi:sialate O-acetylesterase [Catalinimonas niigatensis]|uniref:sialate O-acetylesterase n=1 Tax=Catalinimonas niigatensis TaxID=1397264 RepID=UPI002666815E|nr:sialate O-acetylesterase [Catalinimonas niigatensis]WPP49228.1 sialate O-acetylesterase [Catalinimonas niigatensis]